MKAVVGVAVWIVQFLSVGMPQTRSTLSWPCGGHLSSSRVQAWSVRLQFLQSQGCSSQFGTLNWVLPNSGEWPQKDDQFHPASQPQHFLGIQAVWGLQQLGDLFYYLSGKGLGSSHCLLCHSSYFPIQKQVPFPSPMGTSASAIQNVSFPSSSSVLSIKRQRFSFLPYLQITIDPILLT